MGLLRGVIGLARIISEAAERELYDPAAVRRRVEEIAEARDAGLLSGAEAARLESEAMQRLLWRPGTRLEEEQ